MEHFVEFRSISKSFPGVNALTDVGFRVNGGEVCAFLGENGAGKSTLLKILSGDLKPDKGQIVINGEVATFNSPNDALAASVSVIYQERQTIPTLSIMENIFVGDLPGGFGVVDYKKLRADTQDLLDKFSLPLKPGEIVGRLSVAYQQMVDIIKAYRRNSAIIAFDEPTSSLTDSEVSILFNLIRQLREEGKVIIYVSHRLAEVFQIADRLVVLKDGSLVEDSPIPPIGNDEDLAAARKRLITAMVGRDIGNTYENLKKNDNIGDIVLDVENMSTDYVHDISFTLRKGEIIGFAGLVGSGRTEVVRALFGADKIKRGKVRLEGREVNFKSPADAIEHGIALCPEDRKEQGLVLNSTIAKNVSIPVLRKISKCILVSRKREAALAGAAVDRYSISTPTIDKLVRELSGGNQQKVILGRWTSDQIETKILILDEPTKGIDVRSKAEIYQMMCDIARQGMSVIFISSELTEVLSISDRIIVMHNGHITKIVESGRDVTEEGILAFAMLD